MCPLKCRLISTLWRQDTAAKDCGDQTDHSLARTSTCHSWSVENFRWCTLQSHKEGDGFPRLFSRSKWLVTVWLIQVKMGKTLGSKLHSQDKVTARSPPQDQRRCWEQQKTHNKNGGFFGWHLRRFKEKADKNQEDGHCLSAIRVGGSMMLRCV